jgi:nucleotide-binding universal stress UspA family protein
VARRASAIARACDAGLTLVHVIEHFPEDPSNEVIPPEDQDPETFLRDRAHERLLALARRIGAEGARLQVLIGATSAAEQILAFARDDGADLILVGAVGPRPVAPLAGTLAEHLVRHGTIDVLAVCNPHSTEPGPP